MGLECFSALIEDNDETIEQSEGAELDLDDKHNEQYFPICDKPHDASFVDISIDNGPGTTKMGRPAPGIIIDEEHTTHNTIHADFLCLHHRLGYQCMMKMQEMA